MSSGGGTFGDSTPRRSSGTSDCLGRWSELPDAQSASVEETRPFDSRGVVSGSGAADVEPYIRAVVASVRLKEKAPN